MCEDTFEKQEVLRVLEPYRLLDIRNRAGIPADGYISQLREDGDNRWLFIAHGKSRKIRIVLQKRS